MAGTIGEVVGVSVAGSGVTVAGLIYGQGGLTVTQASLTSISYKVTRHGSGVTNAQGLPYDDGVQVPTGSGSLAVGSVIFDVPVTNDPRYTKTGGYSFLALLPAAAFQVGGLLHRIAVVFVPVTGEQFTQTWKTIPVPNV